MGEEQNDGSDLEPRPAAAGPGRSAIASNDPVETGSAPAESPPKDHPHQRAAVEALGGDPPHPLLTLVGLRTLERSDARRPPPVPMSGGDAAFAPTPVAPGRTPAPEASGRTPPPEAPGRTPPRRTTTVPRPQFRRAILPSAPVDSAERSSLTLFASPRATSSTNPESGDFERAPILFGGRYEILREVGAGGMGRVYEATQVDLGRRVALKVMSAEYRIWEPRLELRFGQEVYALAQLSHPNIVTIYDFGSTPNGDLYIAMEMLDGCTLFEVLQEERTLSLDRATRIAVSLCKALAHTHRSGILHRDLKPKNIMILDNGEEEELVKVLDFGLAKSLRPEDEGITLAGSERASFLGTPRYMAPEQIRKEQLDARSDIYSIGVLLFEMLSGKPPFAGESDWETISRQLRFPAPTLAEVGVQAGAISTVVERCLQRNREDRFGSAEELLRAIRTASDLEHTSNAFIMPPPRRPPRRTSGGRTSRLAYLALANLILFSTVGALTYFELWPSAPFAWRSKDKKRVRLSSSPSGALVRLEGVELGMTPVEVDVPRLPATKIFEFRLVGYAPTNVTVTLDDAESQDVVALLDPLPRERAVDPPPDDFKFNPY